MTRDLPGLWGCGTPPTPGWRGVAVVSPPARQKCLAVPYAAPVCYKQQHDESRPLIHAHLPGAALALTLAGMGTALPPSLPSPAAPPERTNPGPQGQQGSDLQLRVAYTPFYTRQPGWFRQFECAAGRASPLLQAAIGRRLAIAERTLWRAPAGERDPYALRAHLIRNVEPGDADLVVGLLPSELPDGGAAAPLVEDGLAAYSQGYVLLRVSHDLCSSGRLLAHEVAHIFGGVHRALPDNLMNHAAPGDVIDELNAALFALHRNRSVRHQPPPLRGTDLRMMWRLARADTSAADTWLRVGILAARMGNDSAACEHYEHALAIDPALRDAWVNMGHARLQLGDFGRAEDAYRNALALHEADGLVHNNLAVVYLSTGQVEHAGAAMRRALELGYNVPEPLRDAIGKAGGPPVDR